MPAGYLRNKSTCPYKGKGLKEVLQHECVCYDCADYPPGCLIRPTIVSTHNGRPMRDILRERSKRPEPKPPARYDQVLLDDVYEEGHNYAERMSDGWETLLAAYPE